MPAGNVLRPNKGSAGAALPVGRQESSSSPFDATDSSLADSPFNVVEPARQAPPGETRREQRGQDVHTDRSRYFVITSNTADNVVKSVRHNLWATQKKNEQKLDEAFRTAPSVLLVFSVNGTGAFQGYARMRSSVGRTRSKGADPFNGFGRLFEVEWLRLHDLPYREVNHLRNPLAEDRQVQFSRDGQELANSIGQRLCKLIDKHIEEPESFPAAQQQAPPWQPPSRTGPMGWSGAGPTATSPFAVVGGDRDDAESRKRRKLQNVPHPLEDGFDKQVELFLGLEYDEYVEWWRLYGAVSPGPSPPP